MVHRHTVRRGIRVLGRGVNAGHRGQQRGGRAAGYTVVAVLPLPDSDWFDDYYTPLGARLDVTDTSDPAMAEAVAASRAEIELRRRHGADYQYTGYVLRLDEDESLRR
ncbi:hypothetical protein [Phytohabitans rumicis]|nr:hypothetical protein [Phytohabitans rumicis]